MRPGARRLVFAAAAVLLAVVATFVVLLGVDVYLHGRYERSAGYNVWGYRGRAVGKKQPNEYRVVMLGGSAAYGYGVTADEAVPAVLEKLLAGRSTVTKFTVVNLGYNNEGAYSFAPTLHDYAWLKYDLALLYEGYNDLSSVRPNLQVFRHDSPVFRLTGYLPIFPIIFKEKADAMVSGGRPGTLYGQKANTEFHASLATTAGADVLNAAADIAQSLETQLGRVAVEPLHQVITKDGSCAAPWTGYCSSVAAAIEFARSRGTQVIVGTQPYLALGDKRTSRHFQQQSALREFLARRYANDPDVRYVDLGDVIDLEDPHLSFDHMHLRTEGNKRIAEHFVEPVVQLAERAKAHQS